jgi:hypothetical protein
MQEQQAQADKLEVRTDVLWGIANWCDIEDPKAVDCGKILNFLFPGIEYSLAQKFDLADEYARPEISAQHPLLTTFNTESRAVEFFGPTLTLKTARPCNGYEWQDWGR